LNYEPNNKLITKTIEYQQRRLAQGVFPGAERASQAP